MFFPPHASYLPLLVTSVFNVTTQYTKAIPLTENERLVLSNIVMCPFKFACFMIGLYARRDSRAEAAILANTFRYFHYDGVLAHT
jgi:hypothetical protein